MAEVQTAAQDIEIGNEPEISDRGLSGGTGHDEIPRISELLIQPEDNAESKDELGDDEGFREYREVLNGHEDQYIAKEKARKEQMELFLTDKDNVPASYYNTSAKEELILKYADNFNRQYIQIYPGRKELLLCPINEFGIRVRTI